MEEMEGNELPSTFTRTGNQIAPSIVGQMQQPQRAADVFVSTKQKENTNFIGNLQTGNRVFYSPTCLSVSRYSGLVRAQSVLPGCKSQRY